MMRLRAGIACKKWCSNGTSHQTVVRYVEEGDRRFVFVCFVCELQIEYEHKKVLVKRKPAKIAFDEISLLRNIPGTNSFVVEYEK